jgi:hypothetical protein
MRVRSRQIRRRWAARERRIWERVLRRSDRRDWFSRRRFWDWAWDWRVWRMDCLRFRMEVWRDWESLRATQGKVSGRGQGERGEGGRGGTRLETFTFGGEDEVGLC